MTAEDVIGGQPDGTPAESSSNGALQPLVDLIMSAEDALAGVFGSLVSLLGPSFFLFAGILLFSLCCFVYFDKKRKERDEAEIQKRLAHEAKMTLEYRPDGWTLEEIKPFDGNDPEKPILFGCKGKVYNVWRGGEEFYGKDACYQVFSGTDATRLLAKGILDPETEEEAAKELSWFEKDTLANWIDTFEWKYDDVGPLIGYNPADHGLGGGKIAPEIVGEGESAGKKDDMAGKEKGSGEGGRGDGGGERPWEQGKE
jgi:hypothetical protein